MSQVVSRDLELLVFELDAQRFALETASVQEVMRAVAIRALPRAPSVIEGVIDLRGTMVPVFDLRTRFRMPPRALSAADHFIVGLAGGRTVALRADRALAVRTLPRDSVRDLGRAVPDADYVAGAVTLVPEGLVLIHDLATFLSAAERDVLEAALA